VSVDLIGWRQDAACKDTPGHWWFPNDDLRGVPLEAAATCNRCPVRAECHEHALRHERHGVWAGTSERARQRLRRTLRIRLETIEIDPVAELAAELLEQGTPPPDIAGALGVSTRTAYRYLTRAGVELTEPDDWRRRTREIS
jgi:transposase-like protein